MVLDQSTRDLLLKLYPYLKKVESRHLEEALQSAFIKKCHAGQQLWTEAEKLEAFPFIIKGFGRVYKMSPNGRELILYYVGPGDPCVLATGSMLNSSQVNARAMCEEDYEMVCFTLSAFKKLLVQSDAFRDAVLGELAKHLAELTEMTSANAFQNLDQRLAATLLAKKTPIHTTHQMLADELGSVREIVSRILKNFSAKGWIDLQRGQISILKPERLKEFLNLN